MDMSILEMDVYIYKYMLYIYRYIYRTPSKVRADRQYPRHIDATT